MLKKIVTIALSLLLLVSAMGVSAEIVTETSGKVIYTDDFEHVSITSDSGEKTVNGYTNGSDKYESDVISPAASRKEGRGSIWKGIGVDGSQAFKSRTMSASSDTNKRRLYTRALDIGASGTKWYEFTVDFQTSAVCNGLYLFSDLFYFNNSGVVRVYESGSTDLSDGGTYAANTWYKGVVVVHGTDLKGWIYDGEGNLVAKSEKAYSDSGYEAKKLLIYAVGPSYANDPFVTLDNLKIVEYDPSVVAPTCDAASIAPNEADVARNAKLTFAFDQLMTVDETQTGVVNLGKVEENGSITPVSGATLAVSDVDSHKAEITYTGLLERNTDYVISFANLKNSAGLACTEAYRFTTEDLHLWEPVDIETIGTPDSGTGLTPITFTIEDSYDYPTFSGAAMVMVYQNNKMVDFDFRTLTAAPTGDCTVDFDLVTIPAGAEVRIILVDCVGELIPLATGVTTN